VDGDWAYAGQLTKNPIHPSWETIYGSNTPYELKQLVTIHTPRQMPRKPERAAGLGRNVTMFDTARTWAYRAWWHHRTGTMNAWDKIVLQYCHHINTQFAAPLPLVEIQATSQSISRWIWRNFDETKFRALQAHRGQKGGRIGGQKGGRIGGKVVTEAKREANRKRATKLNVTLALEEM
jgi:hypothetical protein